jgi:hypothetical protein
VRRCDSSAQSKFAGKTALLMFAIAGFLAQAIPAHAARVSGTFTGYEHSTPQKGASLHFENRVTRDAYMTLTADDGSFGANLPPGIYRLRGERGAILTGPITVGTNDVTLGTVGDLAPYSPARLCGLQYLAPAILISRAPSTANIMTLDTTAPLPPIAPAGSIEPVNLPPPPAAHPGVE